MPCTHLTLKTLKPRNPAYHGHLVTWGDHIRKRRLDLGLHQKDVARIVNATTSTVTNWEKGRTSPTLDFVPKVIQFLGYNPERTKEETWEQRIKRIRFEKALTLKVVARKLGVDPQTVGRWEEGQSRPKGKVLDKLSKWYEL